MKNFIYKLCGFDKALQQAFEIGYKSHQKEVEDKKEVNEIRSLSLNFPIGEKFMIFSNNPAMRGNQKVFIAKVVGYELLGSQMKPLFQDLETQTKFMSMGVQVRYDEEKYKTFSKLSWDEQWNVVAHNCNGLTKQEANNIENNRPAWQNK